ncbi:MAG: methyltransferase domain-containing protein [Gordonia sp. (in: high G+C Gram-positive bacteria)]
MPVWDPARYLQFADHRTRPFLDLIAQIPSDAESIIDLGCGPGHLMGHLRTRWPEAHILGIDSSPEMIQAALRGNNDPQINYDVADIVDWNPPQPVDVIISNAVFQWIPDQFAVLDRVLGFLNPGGTCAVQVPANASAPTHTTLAELAAREPYAEYLRGIAPLPATSPLEYLEFFADRGLHVNAWETTYVHVLDGDHPVFDWISGTGARPYLQALPDDLVEPFSDDLRARFREIFPTRDWGTALPFRRTFAVATLPTGPFSPGE